MPTPRLCARTTTDLFLLVKRSALDLAQEKSNPLDIHKRFNLCSFYCAAQQTIHPVAVRYSFSAYAPWSRWMRARANTWRGRGAVSIDQLSHLVEQCRSFAAVERQNEV